MTNLSIYTENFIAYCKLRKTLNSKTIKAYSTDLKHLRTEFILKVKLVFRNALTVIWLLVMVVFTEESIAKSLLIISSPID